jgi:ribonuclease VapC
MIVDASALIAVLNRAPGYKGVLRALVTGPAALPAPSLSVFHLATARHSAGAARMGEELIRALRRADLEIPAYEERHAAIVRRARETWPHLNLTGLMVYVMAKDRAAPILTASPAYGATDAVIHPASLVA